MYFVEPPSHCESKNGLCGRISRRNSRFPLGDVTEHMSRRETFLALFEPGGFLRLSSFGQDLFSFNF